MLHHYEELKHHLGEIRNLQKSAAVLTWDQETKMPAAGSRSRAATLATLARLAHTMFMDDTTASLLQAAAEETRDAPYDSNEAALARVAQRDLDRARKLPADLVTEMTRHSALAHDVWVEARLNNDFAAFAPCLERTLELARTEAECIGYDSDIYDALIDGYEPGMTAAEVRRVFDDLRTELVPLVRAIADSGRKVDDSAVHGTFDPVQQERFGAAVARSLGYDFSRGRLDSTVHPFETALARDDVRITTRYEPTFFNAALFGIMHEAGHGIYEQGVAEDLEGTLLCRGASSALHESQSRLWENVVGRSRGFWEHTFPLVQEHFPAQFGSIDLDTFYAAINYVHPSFIRVEADEVTYNLHIMLRFEMELGLLDGSISVADAPSVWNTKMQEYLGVLPPTDTLGILQDIHWSSGLLGHFPTYALGNIMSLQLFDAAVAAHPEIPGGIASGQFDTLRGWLTENLYRHGRKFTPVELLQRATGEPLQARSYMRYLRAKFGALYDIS